MQKLEQGSLRYGQDTAPISVEAGAAPPEQFFAFHSGTDLWVTERNACALGKQLAQYRLVRTMNVRSFALDLCSSASTNTRSRFCELLNLLRTKIPESWSVIRRHATLRFRLKRNRMRFNQHSRKRTKVYRLFRAAILEDPPVPRNVVLVEWIPISDQ
jgi:hypothetical protein